MSPIAVLSVLVRANTAQANAALATLDKQMASTGGRAGAMGSRISGALKGIGLASVAVGVGAIALSTQFNQAMTLVQTQAGGSAKEVKKLSGEVLALSRHSQFSPKELADGLFRVESHGFRGAEAMKVLRNAMNFAAVGNSDLESTTYALSAALDSGIKGTKNMGHATGTLNAIVGAGSMRMDELIGALSTGLLPNARIFGVTLRQVGSALGVLTREGMPAQMAATRLRMSLSLLGAPTDKAIKELATIGLTGKTLAKDMRNGPEGLITAIQDLHDHLQKLNPTDQAQLLSRAFGGGRSSAAIISLVQSVDDLGSVYDQVGRKAGEFGTDVKVQAQTPAAQFKTALSGMEAALIKFGDQLAGPAAHELKRFSQALTDPTLSGSQRITKAMAILGEDIQRAIPKVVGIAAKMGAGIAKGIATGFVNSNDFTRLLTVAALVRVFGGKGAITASGMAIGRMLGIGVAAGAAETEAAALAVGGGAGGASKLAAGGAGVAAGGAGEWSLLRGGGAAAGAASGSKFGGAFLGKASSALKNVRWARVAGLGIGLALANSALDGLKARSQAKSPDIMEMLAGKTTGGFRGGAAKALDLPAQLGVPGFGKGGIFDISSDSEKAAGKIKDMLNEIHDAGGKVTMDQVAQIQHWKEQTSLTAEQRTSVAALVKQMEAAARLKVNLTPTLDPQAVNNLHADLKNLNSGAFTSIRDIQKVAARANQEAGAAGLTGPDALKAKADVMRATARAIGQGFKSGAIPKTKEGIQQVKNLIRNADLTQGLRPARFGLGFARGFKSGAIPATKAGIEGVIAQLKLMPPMAQKVAAETMLKQLKEFRDNKKITVKQFRDIRSGILAQLTGLKTNSKTVAKQVNTALKGFDTNTPASKFDALRAKVKASMGDTVGGVKRGTALINQILKAEFAALGIPDLFMTSQQAAKQHQSTLAHQGKMHGGIVKAQAGAMVPGSGSGDTVPLHIAGRLAAMVEPGELVSVANRSATKALMGVNAMVPRRAEGGTIPTWSGHGAMGVMAARAQNIESDAASQLLAKAIKQAAAATGGGTTMGPKGIGSFEGLRMANWVIQSMQHARRKGFTGKATSGYRSHATNVAAGRNYVSEHEGTQYPHGAVDFGGMVDPASLPIKMAAVAATRGFKYPLLPPAGFRDDGHASGTGHMMGGILKLKKGGWFKVGATYEGLDGHQGAYGKVGGMGFAELLVAGANAGLWKQDLASVLGLPNKQGTGMPAHTKLQFRLPGGKKSVTAEKNDIGSGQAGSHYKVDIQTGLMNALGWKPNNDVEVSAGGGGAQMNTRQRKAAAKARKLGLSPKLQRAVTNLQNQANIYSEYADRASQLSGDVSNSAEVYGHDELYWLNQELAVLWRLRNKLLAAAAAVIKERTKLESKLAKAQTALTSLKGIKKPSKAQKKQMSDLTKSIAKDKQGISDINSKHGDLFTAITDVQGNGAPQKVMAKMPQTPGMFGGQIFDVQMQIKSLGENAASTTDSEANKGLTADQLKELHYLTTLGVMFNPSQFSGFFAAGGYLGAGKWGIAGERGAEAVLGPAHILPMGGSAGSVVRVVLEDYRTAVYQDGKMVREIVHEEMDKDKRDKSGAYKAGAKPR